MFESRETVIACGSFVETARAKPKDIDLICIRPGGCGQKEVLGQLDGLPVEVTYYDADFGKLVSSNSRLALLLCREIRKIRFGICLQGAQVHSSLIRDLGATGYDVSQLKSLVGSTEISLSEPKSERYKSSLWLFSALEFCNLIGGLLWSKRGPRKPRWYLNDLTEIYSGPFTSSIIQCLNNQSLVHFLKSRIQEIKNDPSIDSVTCGGLLNSLFFDMDRLNGNEVVMLQLCAVFHVNHYYPSEKNSIPLNTEDWSAIRNVLLDLISILESDDVIFERDLPYGGGNFV